jgi:membrane protease YdiL (CAAX protease family)
MAPLDQRHVLLAALMWLLLACFIGIVVSWGWMIRQFWMRRPLLPERPLCDRRVAPWGIVTVLLVVFLHGLTQYAVVKGYERATGRSRTKPAGPGAATVQRKQDVAKSARETPVDGPPHKAGEPRDEGRDINQRGHTKGSSKQAQARAPDGAAVAGNATKEPDRFSNTEQMFLVALIDSLLLVFIPLLARVTAGARLRDLGVCCEGLRAQVATGLVAILIALPLVYLVQYLAVHIWWPKESHPLEVMLRKQFTPEVAYLAVVTAVLVAPMLEELIFRAIFLSWLSQHEDLLRALIPWLGRRAGESTPFLAPPEALSNSQDWSSHTHACDPSNPWSPPQSPVAPVAAPSETGDVGATPSKTPICAIVLTSMMFAALHAPQWPAPIPLFFLALVLGIVYTRTGSLLATIIMHAVFNGISTVMLFAILLLRPAL